jgi:lysophospholipase L1-like esterase
MKNPETSVNLKLRGYMRRVCILAVAIAICALVCVSAYVFREHSFDDYRSVPSRQLPMDWFAHVKVGIIGDSWVAGKKLDDPLRQRLLDLGLNVEVVSSGHPGAKSRQLYRDLFADQTNPESSKALLLDDDLDYLVVIAGVNDTAGHIGRDFYAHHMLGIIQAAQERAVQPLVVEVPEYGIECPPPMGLSWCKRLLFLYLFDGGKVDVIEDYRRELSAQLPKLAKPVTVIQFKSVARDYASSTNLYANPSHLNKQGNVALASLIAQEVIELHNKTVQRTGADRLTEEINRASPAGSRR